MPTNEQLVLMLLGAGFYAAASAGAILYLRRPDHRRRTLVWAMLAHGIAANVVLLIWRVLEAGTIQAIAFGFDAMIVIALLVAIETAVIDLSGRLRGVDAFLTPMAVLFQLGSLLMLGRPRPGVHYRDWFVVGHEVVLALAGAFLVASGVAGIVYLLMYRALRRKQAAGLRGRLPSLESLERFGRGAVAAGFPLLTFGMLTGFCQAAQSAEPWPSLRRAAPTIGLWGLYAAALVGVWIRAGFRGPRAAASAAVGSALTIASFTVYLVHLSHVR